MGPWQMRVTPGERIPMGETRSSHRDAHSSGPHNDAQVKHIFLHRRQRIFPMKQELTDAGISISVT